MGLASRLDDSDITLKVRQETIGNMNTKIKILVLAANPVNTTQLRLGEEVRSIEEALERAKYRDRFELVSKWAVRVDDLLKALLDHRPQIVHFSGHGQGTATGSGARSSDDSLRKLVGLESELSASGYEGLVLEDDRGEAKLVNASALASLFESFQNDVDCVVLNACYSEMQANAIHQHINCVVGMNKAIGDRAAIRFATEFYRALATGSSFDFAYQLARKGLDLNGIPESLTPVLKNRKGTDDPFHLTASKSDSDAAAHAAGTNIRIQGQNTQMAGDNAKQIGQIGQAGNISL
jgi:hypothetical protein